MAKATRQRQRGSVKKTAAADVWYCAVPVYDVCTRYACGDDVVLTSEGAKIYRNHEISEA